MMIKCSKHQGKEYQPGIQVSPDVLDAIEAGKKNFPEFNIIDYCLNGEGLFLHVLSRKFCEENHILDVGKVEMLDKKNPWENKLVGACRVCLEQFVDLSDYL